MARKERTFFENLSVMKRSTKADRAWSKSRVEGLRILRFLFSVP